MIFTCSWEKCSRVLGSREQLAKHERSHEGHGRYTCRVCDRSYARSDILSRHMVRNHGMSPPVMGRPRRVSCTSCRNVKAICDGTAPDPCSRCDALRSPCYYPHDLRRSSGPDRFHKPVEPKDMNEDSCAMSLVSSSIGQSYRAIQDQIPQRTSHDSIPLPSAPSIPDDFDPSTIDWLGMFGLDAPSAEQFDWNTFDLPEEDVFEALNSHAPTTPSCDLLGSVVPPRDPDYDLSPERLHGTPSEIPDGQPFDSPWPHIDKPRSSDVNVALPYESAGITSSLSPSDAVPGPSRQTMIAIVARCHRSIWPAIDTTNFPSIQTLTICINLYLRHFHDWLPIIERKTFEMEGSAPLIMMTLASIGAMYSQDGLQRLGEAMSELVRRAVLFVGESDRRFMFETNIIQAHLLQTCFGFFCGSHKAFQQAELSRGALIVACKRMHLLRPGKSASEAVYANMIAPSVGEIAAAEKEDRRRARLGWGIYLLDCQLACLVNLPAQLSISEILAPFPSLAALQEPQTARRDNPISFADVLDGFLTEGVSPMSLDDLGYSVISYTLYRLCMDACAFQSIHRSRAPQPFKLEFPSHVKHPPQILLDRIASHALNLAQSPSPLLVSCSALAHHAHMQFTYPSFIEQAKISAGKSGTLPSRMASRSMLEAWIESDSRGARTIFAHASMLVCLLKRYKFDTPTEVIWTFDAALCIWAVLRFSRHAIANGPSITVISWAETPQIEQWIGIGGSALVQGLGEVSTLHPDFVLEHFARELETLSWGLAGQYRQILHGLLNER